MTYEQNATTRAFLEDVLTAIESNLAGLSAGDRNERYRALAADMAWLRDAIGLNAGGGGGGGGGLTQVETRDAVRDGVDLALTQNTGTIDASTIRATLATNDGLLTALGAIADAASSTGSLMARLRQLATATGVAADSASPSGSLMARAGYLAAATGAIGDPSDLDGTVMSKLLFIATQLNRALTNNTLLSAVTATGPGSGVSVSSDRYLTFFFTATGVSGGVGAVIELQAIAPDSTWHPLHRQTINANTADVAIAPVSFGGVLSSVRANVISRSSGTYTVAMTRGR